MTIKEIKRRVSKKYSKEVLVPTGQDMPNPDWLTDITIQETAQEILKEVQEYLDEIDATFATLLWSYGYEKQMKKIGKKWIQLKKKFLKGEKK